MLCLIPFIAAFIGWLIHKGFIYCLFNKTISANQSLIAERISGYVAAEFNIGQLSVHLADTEQIAALKPEIEKHIDIFLNEKLKEKMPMIAMFVGEKTIDKIKEGLLEEIDLLLPVILQKLAGNLDKKIDIASMVRKKINGIDKQDFARRIKNASRKQAGKLEILGALTGFVIGWVCVLCFLLIK